MNLIMSLIVIGILAFALWGLSSQNAQEVDCSLKGGVVWQDRCVKITEIE